MPVEAIKPHYSGYNNKAKKLHQTKVNNSGKKVIVSVINDLVTDQRVHKVCTSLTVMGFDVLLVGRVQKKSPPMDKRSYRSHRMKLFFESGPWFYAEYNIRLFLLLFLRNKELLVSNDLDTLLPNYLISKIWNLPLVYDSHEYFTEVPELVSRPSVQRIWKRIEQSIFPKLKHVITVNDSIASLFEKDYGKRPEVVRNIPPGRKLSKSLDRKALKLPEDKKILILQGSGINMDRGSEELVEAISLIEDAVLLIVGDGDVIPILKQTIQLRSLEDKVIIKPRQPYEKMMQYTLNADLGLTLDKDSNLNYRFSLPNKLFDYIHAGLPIIASRLPEIEQIINTYDIGSFIPDHKPENIAKTISETLANQELMKKWKKNTTFAAQQLSWENEENILKEVYTQYA